MKLFVVSDIHSFYYKLCRALDNMGWDDSDPTHILLCDGDLFDRGKYPKELFEFVKDLAEKNRFIYVRGNHEDLLLDCLREIAQGVPPGWHHYRNKTIETICRICGIDEWMIDNPEQRDFILNTMQPVVDFITKASVNYYEIDNYVFVHGWVPCSTDYQTANDEQWSQARWINGMKAWQDINNRVPNKTVVCGHFHTSWGWAHIRNKYEEWPDLHNKNFAKSFGPFVDDGIIALDGCIAYSGKVNCMIFEFKGELK